MDVLPTDMSCLGPATHHRPPTRTYHCAAPHHRLLLFRARRTRYHTIVLLLRLQLYSVPCHVILATHLRPLAAIPAEASSKGS